MAPAPAKVQEQQPRPRVLRGSKKPFWSCACGMDGNWACRIECSCGKQAPQRIITAAKKADAAARAGDAPSKRAGGSGLVEKPAPWCSKFKLMEAELAKLRNL
eukprot:2291490-Pyramimonas_sp.AAC.1